MVIKMQESGFCFGARNAVNKAMQCEEKSNQVILFGNLVNNEHVMQNFRNKGFQVLEDTRLVAENSIVVLRAHGVPLAIYDELEKKNVIIEDCTCVKVSKIHKIVYEKSHNNYKVVIVGKKTHPEVVGTMGWCRTGSVVVVVEKESDLECIDLSGKVCVVAQTTCSKELWESVTQKMRNKKDTVEIYDTLCNVMRNREEQAKAIARTVDMMLVIGDKCSSNSNELYKQCCDVCENTFFISSFIDLQNNDGIIKNVLHNDNIGLAGSASAPDDVIDDVYNFILFLDFLKCAKKEIEGMSYQYLDDFRANAIDNLFVQEALEALVQQNEGGKRIRGAMIKLGEKIALHGKNEHYLPIAVGYELFQTAILIHDDIIDKGDMRRNKETIHVDSAKKIEIIQGGRISAENAAHYGMARALCIGDYGFFIAYQLLERCNIDSSTMIKVYQLYSEILTHTCEGEIMDTELPFARDSILDNYEVYKNTVYQIYEFKTAWYTLAGPIMLGAVCGGGSENLLTVLKRITIPLGIAFQIKDDLLGIYSSDEVLGKSVMSDIREGKQTFLLGFAYNNANDGQRQLLNQHYGKQNADEKDLAIVRKVFEETGARKYAQDEIYRLSNDSKALIDNDLIDEEYQHILRGLISYLIDRKF